MITTPQYDVIIIGAGAAGLMCAMRAGRRGCKVLLLDRGEKVGAKILVSGGGRCNFTNRNITAKNYISDNPHFCLSALNGYTPDDFIALLEKHRIAYHEKTLGQLFCDHSAQDIINMLVAECAAAHVDIRLGQHIKSVEKSDVFHVTMHGQTVTAQALVLATGGLSIPKMGQLPLVIKWRRSLGLLLFHRVLH